MKINHIIIFMLGAAFGTILTRGYLKGKYEEQIQEEIDSVKKVYSAHCRKREEIGKEAEEASTKEPVHRADMTNYHTVLTGSHYISKEDKEDMEEKNIMEPYLISPEELGEEYDVVELTYYADDVLADDSDDPLDNSGDVVGETWKEHFGDHEDDAVFIRNDRLKTDYEIVLDQRKYAEVIKTGPRKHLEV